MGDKTPDQCETCPWVDVCGGWDAGCCTRALGTTCLDCTECCIRNPVRFSRMVSAVAGLQLDDIRAQPQSIPSIPYVVDKPREGTAHGYGWAHYPVAATTLKFVIGRRRTARARNGLPSTSLLIVDGCCKDPILERLWVERANFLLHDNLAAESPCLLIAPDMSVYVDMPACHKLYQIRRTFLMYERYQRHGLRAIPFLAPDNRKHALHFASWLRNNPCVTHVAASFQTLQRRRQVWRRQAELLDITRQEISPRRLVWVFIGQRPRPWLDERFESVRYIVTPPRPAGPASRRRASGMLRLPLGS